MKAAVGELNLTVITVVAIAAIATLLTVTLWPKIKATITGKTDVINDTNLPAN